MNNREWNFVGYAFAFFGVYVLMLIISIFPTTIDASGEMLNVNWESSGGGVVAEANSTISGVMDSWLPTVCVLLVSLVVVSVIVSSFGFAQGGRVD